MATLLSHGTVVEASRAMHRFFQTADRPRQSPPEAIIDGDRYGSSVTEIGNGPPVPVSVSSALAVPPLHPVPDESDIIMSNVRASSSNGESLAVDPTEERRKRRRTTPIQLNGACSDGDDQVQQKMSWKQQLEEAATVEQSAETPDLSCANLDGASSAKEEDTQGTLIPLKRKARRTPREPKPKLILDEDDGTSSKEVARTSKPRTSPKVLKLSGNGKLLQSPKRVAKTIAPAPPAKSIKSTMKLKNGRMVPSLTLVLRYNGDVDNRAQIGKKIHQILSTTGASTTNENLKQEVAALQAKPNTTTHPFFLGRLAEKPGLKLATSMSDASVKGQESDVDNAQSPKNKDPTPWKDLVFTSSVRSQVKSLQTFDPLWPPHDIQHVDGEIRRNGSYPPLTSTEVLKHKHRIVQLDAAEDVLRCFSHELQRQHSHQGILEPTRETLSGREMAERLDTGASAFKDHPAVAAARRRLVTSSSAFDRGAYAGPQDWPHQYAPTCWEEVLQPQSEILYHWLNSLHVHETKMKSKIEKKEKVRGQKKKAKKYGDDLDDFIATSEDEDDLARVKNAILITGPPGCGKSASVFAIAKQLGFEVFEIHPGMKRSAKDIFDKVGDMTQNHLVQKKDQNASDVDDIASIVSGDDMPTRKHKQGGKFFDLKPNNKDALPTKKTQRQSLILLEEVDVLFEDDKSFWNGVQALIEQSRRPVIMTCNDAGAVPVELINLHATLSYTAPDAELATELLTYIAASEGHILDREAVSSLYSSKNKDLRAALMELNLWCQMAVGSTMGGLDWMNHGTKRAFDGSAITSTNRIFSCNTYTTGIDIVPELQDEQDYLSYLQDQLGCSVSEWECLQMKTETVGDQDDLTQFSMSAEARSYMDLCDASVALLMSSLLTNAFPRYHSAQTRARVMEAFQRQDHDTSTYQQHILHALAPLEVEKLTFPSAQGRLAPTIELYSAKIALDVAPYVRAIVSFDKQLEQQRDVLEGGSQGKKARRTRAAIAALEGGSKSSTRGERWFTKELIFDKVLNTGGRWPLWPEKQDELSAESPDPLEA